jgi:hypothetical protein
MPIVKIPTTEGVRRHRPTRSWRVRASLAHLREETSIDYSFRVSVWITKLYTSGNLWDRSPEESCMLTMYSRFEWPK